MTPCKVLHVIERFNVAGAEVVVQDLLRLFEGSPWEMSVCVLHDKGIIGTEMFEKGFPVHHLDWANDRLNDAGVAARMRKVFDEVGPDVVHAHNVTPWYFATRASWNRGQIRRCATLHGFLTGTGVWKKKGLYTVLSRTARRIAIVSPRIAGQLRTVPLFPLQRVEVIPNGIQTDAPADFSVSAKRAELGLQDGDFVIGTVGRMFAEKNIEMQIRLLARLRRVYPQLKLVVVAKQYDYFQVLDELVTELGVRDRVVFTGLRRDVPELLRSFDLFVMSSFSEGTSIALLEAMAAGLAVVVSDVGGNGDVVAHGENGLLFDVHQLDEFAGHVASLIEDGALRRRLAAAARKTAETYSLESMKTRYQGFYQAIMGQHAV